MKRFAMCAMMVLCPMLAEAQPLAPVGSFARARARTVQMHDARVIELTVNQPPVEQRDGAGRRFLKATLWGTAAGFAAGAVVGSQIQTGCDLSPPEACGEKHGRLKMVLGFGMLGSVVGTSAGALVGVLMR